MSLISFVPNSLLFKVSRVGISIFICKAHIVVLNVVWIIRILIDI